MYNLFYKAIKCQHDALDKMFPQRNWPAGAVETPSPHVVESIRLHRRGLDFDEIAAKVGKPRRLVAGIVRRSGCR
jgi:hypothetical protein